VDLVNKIARLITEDPDVINESETFSIDKLAEISDKALDDAYHYGRSTPGNNFGWLANVESAREASKVISAGEDDIESIASAIHDGWNKTAMADYKGELSLDVPTPQAKKEKRFGLAQKTYAQLPEEEKEKDRVVARAIFGAIKGNNLESNNECTCIVPDGRIVCDSCGKPIPNR